MDHYCEKHPETKLVCPRCIAAKGGRSTAKKVSAKQKAAWGKKGGKLGGRGRTKTK